VKHESLASCCHVEGTVEVSAFRAQGRIGMRAEGA
jgi:hypothetical protein